jgi:hypothetical protein
VLHKQIIVTIASNYQPLLDTVPMRTSRFQTIRGMLRLAAHTLRSPIEFVQGLAYSCRAEWHSLAALLGGPADARKEARET